MQGDLAEEKYPNRVAKVVRKFRLDDQPSDFAYWQTQPYAARLAALEAIRREYVAWKYGLVAALAGHWRGYSQRRSLNNLF